MLSTSLPDHGHGEPLTTNLPTLLSKRGYPEAKISELLSQLERGGVYTISDLRTLTQNQKDALVLLSSDNEKNPEVARISARNHLSHITSAIEKWYVKRPSVEKTAVVPSDPLSPEPRSVTSTDGEKTYAAAAVNGFAGSSAGMVYPFSSRSRKSQPNSSIDYSHEKELCMYFCLNGCMHNQKCWFSHDVKSPAANNLREKYNKTASETDKLTPKDLRDLCNKRCNFNVFKTEIWNPRIKVSNKEDYAEDDREVLKWKKIKKFLLSYYEYKTSNW